MSNYIIKFKNTSDEEGTIIPDAGFSFSDNLNSINKANIKLSGSSTAKRSLIEVGSQVYIYRNGTLEFHGIVDLMDYLEGGGISVNASGYEVWLAKENGDYANSPWTNTASATIFNAILAECSQPTGSAWSAGTVETGTDIDFRESKTDSLWNAINNLIGKTSQDIGIDYTNTEIDILDHKGSQTSVATFNSGIQMNNIRVTQSYPIGNDVRVYGKGDGDNQIKSSTANGQDAGSKTTYGTIRKIERDSSIVSVAEANKLADSLVAMYKQPTKIYDFEVLNPSQSLVSGDVITLNAGSQNLSNEEVRITGINRGMKGDSEFLTLQVTNKEYSKLLKSRNEILASIEKNARDNQTYMSGTSNILTFSEMINANNTAPLRIRTPLPSSFIYDEVGNKRVNSFTIDYDVDPFRKGVGTSSADNSTTGAGITNASSVTNAGITNASSETNAGITNSRKGASDAGYYFGGYSSSLTGNNSWRAVGTSLNIGSYDYLFHGAWGCIRIELDALIGYTWNQAVAVRIKNTTDTIYYPDSSGIELSTGYSAHGYSTVVYPFYIHIPYNWSNKNYVIEYKLQNETWWFGAGTQEIRYSYHGSRGHIHSNSFNDASHTNSNSFNDANHTNSNSFNDASHNHDVTIGDGISDSGSVNASQVSIYLDWYNTGTSTWDNKHSILNTGKTLDTDVDISDSGTYPDAAGFWRVRIITDNATPDLVQGVIKLKHQLDT